MDTNKAVKIIKKTIYYTTPVIIFLTMCLQIFNDSIWLDEAFSLSMIQQSFSEMIKNTAIDVHPPLYYLILKSFLSIIKIFSNNIIHISKLVSLIPILFFMVLNYTSIEKMFNKKTSFLFSIFILGMPQIMKYSIEIRMYSWGMLFVTMVYIYIIQWLNTDKKKYLFLATISSILSAYTHYFAAVSVGCIYLIFLIYIIKKDINKLKKYIISIFGVFLAYIPWIIILIKQVLVVKDNYWITNMTINTIKGFFRYPYTVEGNKILTFIVGMLIIFAIILIIKHKDKNSIYAICGILIPIGTIVIGVVASILIRPVFINRYMICSLGCLWLAVAIMLGNYTNKKKTFPIIAIIAIMVTVYNAKALVSKEKTYNKQFINTIDYINSIYNVNDIYIFDNNQLQRVISYYFSNMDTYVYKGEITQLSKQVYKQTKMNQLDDLQKLKETKKEIYLFASNEAILEDINSYGYEYEKSGTYQIETHKFSIYKIVSRES